MLYLIVARHVQKFSSMYCLLLGLVITEATIYIVWLCKSLTFNLFILQFLQILFGRLPRILIGQSWSCTIGNKLLFRHNHLALEDNILCFVHS